MELKDCTKKELIQIIEQLRRQVGDYYVLRAIFDVENERHEQKMKESKRLLAVMTQKSKEISALYAPYKNEQCCQVPESIAAKMRNIAREYDLVQAEWNKLMGFGAKQ